jgi:orotate phosphoribosyltransferase
MIHNRDSARKVAEFLLQIKAVLLNPSHPFTWSSGMKSPIYCDNRKTLSYPKIRTYLRQQLVSAISDTFGNPEVIAGIATAGIPLGVLVAQDMGLPFIYVRSEPKSHGAEKQVEGDLQSGQSVVLIEDLISTGKSAIKAAEIIKELKSPVKGVVSIFNYNLRIARENLKLAKLNTVSLCDYPTLIHCALESNYINQNDIESLEEWVVNPEQWGLSN